jgi:23S rRNA (adenine2503-C2)-methyltransferase
MTNLSRPDRERLALAIDFSSAQTAAHQASTDGTIKLLLKWPDGGSAETVMIPDLRRRTACVSSQIGCPVGCRFCASGINGLQRNLTAGQIVEQVFALNRLLAPQKERITNIVFMGMGEPLANYARVLGAVRRLTDPVPGGLGISQRGITVSTVGLVPAIERLAGDGLSVRLAVSLHAPDDGLRDELVPVNRRWKVTEVLAAAWAYAAATGRRVSIEYALIRDVNDQAWRADALGRLLAGQLAHVNLIPLNPTPGSRWTASRPADMREFEARLAASGVPVTVRDTRGTQIDGACGQLAATDRAGG